MKRTTKDQVQAQVRYYEGLLIVPKIMAGIVALTVVICIAMANYMGGFFIFLLLGVPAAIMHLRLKERALDYKIAHALVKRRG